ncbi:uncharacterized protein Z519_09952 [Cladophialophora bantiana CBS 173.52]|uniref:Uncharacterized protein n=1 Tax=Cladophialophora bantiana (strain ATCC 10958 / CBS 173.52 / CDC B-1940 / NIH 8579) TaxID=1442370 RepID=A0A0D2HG64_CLAB1|nr:uncharacterized protein Z519_09952 [Cladophialophora bantiana CBS 173.52]KIW89795.1 hypothetical protein Z519_09952 [Cladophialophora bantiana CBS 173.52]
MDDEKQLKYELAEIEFDKRQLQLERRELAIKRRLEQLKTNIDLTKDDAVLKTEAGPGGTDGIRATAQNRSSAEPQSDTTSTVITANATLKLGETSAVEQQPQREADDTTSETGNGAQGSTFRLANRDRGRTAAAVRRRSYSYLLKERPTVQQSHEDLLTSFIRPPTHPTSRSQQKRSQVFDGRDNETVSSGSGTDVDTTDSAGGPRAGLKRRRMLQKDENQPADTSSIMTESQKYDLIRHYTGLLLRRMAAVEPSLPPEHSKRPTVTSRLRRATNGETHQTLAFLHEEFQSTVNTWATICEVRRVLSDELAKFHRAQRFWWPRCTALDTQQERMSFVTKVVEDIAQNKFNEQKFEEEDETNNDG